jgi:hypothetical protein
MHNFDELDGRPTKMQWQEAGKISKEFLIDTIERSKFEHDVEYRFNKEGFRMDEDLCDIVEPCVVYLGDSTTMGYAINLDDTWAYKHHQKHHPELKYVNLANASCSIETCYRLAAYWIPRLNAKHVYLLQPAGNRQEFINFEDEAYINAIWSTKAIKRMGNKTEFDEWDDYEDKLFNEFVSNQRHQKWLVMRSFDALRNLFTTFNLESYVIRYHPPLEFFGEARDGMHAGTKQQDKILEWFENTTAE